MSGIEAAKASLEKELRELCNQVAYQPELVPSLRELAHRHGLSKSLAQRVVRGLCDEGLLFPIHGMGTFAGRAPTQSTNVFLFITEGSAREESIRRAFELRLSSLGAICVSMSMNEAVRQFKEGELLAIQGVWDPSFNPNSLTNLGPFRGVPIVGLEGRVNPERSDAVFFDDFAGAKAATLHLLSHGVRTAVFAGVHANNLEYGVVDWSIRRAEGFRSALESVNLESEAKIFVPDHFRMGGPPEDPFNWFKMGVELGDQFRDIRDDCGIVAANDMVAYGLICSLLRKGYSPESIPPVIGFDNTGCRVGSQLSSMDLPWHELGRVAADLLFKRVSGQLDAKPIVERVPMCQITRLSSTRYWLTRSPSLLNLLRVAEMASDIV